MYRADTDKQNRIYGIIAAILYVVMWGLLIYFVSFRYNIPEEQGDGILINFGDGDFGSGDEDLANSDELADAAQAAQQAAEAAQDNHLTQDFEEAPAIASAPERPAESNRPTPSETRPQPTEQPVETPREVDRRALFPGRSDSDSQSEGTTAGAGNQGNLAGDPAGDHAGTGTGTSGNSYNLSGRSLLESLPVPEYNAREEGRVVIEIRVNQQGNVVSASFRSVGSTTTNSVLVNAAQRAAMRAKFNVDETAAVQQVGTIVYNFRMR